MNDGGTITAGERASRRTNTLDVGGNLTLAAGSTLVIETNNTESDRINVAGSAIIAGSLSLDAAPGLVDYTTLDILTTAGGITGTFTNVDGVSMGDNTGLAVTYTANTVNVTRARIGDANLDQKVDNADIGDVFGNFGNSGHTWAAGDFDGDSDVDNSDIGSVFGNFGFSAITRNALSLFAIAESADTAIAEPANANLVYDPSTGTVVLDGIQSVGAVITNFVLETEDAFVDFASVTNAFGSTFFTATAAEISASDSLTDGLQQIDLGRILAAGLSQSQLQDVLTSATYVGTLGSGVQNFDLVVVPEPATLAMLGAGVLMIATRRRRAE